MKTSIKLLSVLAVLFNGTSVAANGSALIPNFLTDSPSNFYSYFYSSNITSAPVEVTVTFYDASGNVVIDTGNDPSAGYFRAANYSFYIESTAGNSINVTIDAQGTTTISLQSFNSKNGYGKIEWSQADSQTRTAIIAHGRSYRTLSGYGNSYAIPINSGVEF
jgi:hypothetical protein